MTGKTPANTMDPLHSPHTTRTRVGGKPDAPREINLDFERLAEAIASRPEPDQQAKLCYDAGADLLAGLWDPNPTRPVLSDQFEPGTPLADQLLGIDDATLEHARRILDVTDSDNHLWRRRTDPAIYLTLSERGWLSVAGEREAISRVQPTPDTTIGSEFF